MAKQLKKKNLQTPKTEKKPFLTVFEDIPKDGSEQNGNVYRRIVETSNEGILIGSPDGRIQFANRRMAEMLGYTLAEIIRRYGTDFMSEEQNSVILKTRKELSEGKSIQKEYQFRRKDGSVIWTLCNASPLYNSRGEHIANLAMHSDVTERKHAEGQIELERKRLETVLETLPVAVVLIEAKDKKFSYINRRAREIYGFDSSGLSLEENVAAAKARKLDGSYYSIEDMPVNHVFNGQSIFNQNMLMERPDGTSYPIILSAAPILDARGKIMAAVIVFDDITERNKIEERNAFLSAIVESSDDAIIGKTLEGIITSWNKGAEKIYGYTKNEVIGKPITMLTPEDRVGEIERLLKQIKEGKNVQYLETVRVKKDGTKFPVTLTISPIINNQGQIIGASTIAHDITERKKVEEALAKYKDELEIKVKERTEQLQEAYDEIMQSQKALKEANKHLKQYANKITQVQEEERKRIAYELHDDTAQYLSILKMQIGALVSSENIWSPEVKERLQFLERDADRAFNDVRRYSHELRPVVLEQQGLAAALQQIADDFNKLGQLCVNVHKEGIEPELSEDVKLGFFRIAQEALNNSRKHAKASRVNIDIRFNQQGVGMRVSDNGKGFNIKESLKRSGGKGSLGLMSMQERADLINADLKIDSEPGKGTRVFLKAKI